MEVETWQGHICYNGPDDPQKEGGQELGTDKIEFVGLGLSLKLNFNGMNESNRWRSSSWISTAWERLKTLWIKEKTNQK